MALNDAFGFLINRRMAEIENAPDPNRAAAIGSFANNRVLGIVISRGKI
jgi:hypothetical protein